VRSFSLAAAGIVWEAVKGLLRNDGVELAGYIAFNGLLALFPFLIFLFALSGLISSYDTAGMVIEFLFRLAPKNIGDTLAPVIVEVLSRPRGGLLTIGLLFAIWAASSGVDALRLSLNRAYSITEERSIWRLKLQSILFVLVGGGFIFVVALIILLGPILWHVVRSVFFLSINDEQTWIVGRYALGAVLICFTTGMLHFSLPMKRPRLLRVLPGAVATSILWLSAAALFTAYISTLTDYGSTYGNLAGIVLTLLFFDVTALIFIFGAELNASLYRALGDEARIAQ
jgi:membrane protein